MKQSKLMCALGLGLATMIASAASAAQEGPNPNRVWVKFKSANAAGSASARSALATPNLGQRIQALRSKLGAAKAGEAVLNYQFDRINAAVMTLASPEAVKALRANPEVESVEIDQPRYLQAQSVPYGIDQVQARDAWDANRDGVIDTGAATGAGIKVCIIDSGLNKNHEEFAGLTITGYPTGWDTDTCGHGTHVAGTIAAANNSAGVVGVSPGKVSLHIVKRFAGVDCKQATYASDTVAGIKQCEAAGAKVVNMSLGGTISSSTEKKELQAAADRGVLVVAAAGNWALTGAPSLFGTTPPNPLGYPASYPSVLSVASVDSGNQRDPNSEFNSEIDLAAPGVGVRSLGLATGDPLLVGNSSMPADV
ncbi:S8 family serine peptidase, partial [Lysobacter sp. 2RAB21]